MPPQTPLAIPESWRLEARQVSAPCPCGSGIALNNCCLPCILGTQPAATAESLMRSRYTAHVLLAIDYLWETWDKAKRRRSSPEEIRAWVSDCEWLGLEVIATDKGGITDSQGIVSFIARFRHNNKQQEHREISVFHRLSGRWVYVDHA